MRLTKQLREAIYNDLYDLKFKAPEADLQKRIKEFLVETYWAQLTKEEYQLLHTLPEKFLNYGTHSIVFSDNVYNRMEVYLDKHLKSTGSMSKHFNHRDVLPEAYKKFISLAQERDQLKKDKDDFKHQIYAVLNSVTTVKKLKEVWVEVSDIVDRNINPNVSNAQYLPATTITYLNSIIPLPQ